MNINFDRHEIEIPCEGCGRKTKKTIGWIKRNKNFVCSCGANISIETTQFKRELQKTEKSLADFEKSLKKIGKSNLF